MRTITCRVEDEIENRLERLASETHRTKSFYVREAILKSLDEMEDVYLADQVIERIRKGEEKTYSLDEVEARLGLGH
ncbi:MAG TPA: CopG family transcriptional regulator [Geobacter sp.]|nr:CopG family transcriptional regulator [Geobacter sp.]